MYRNRERTLQLCYIRLFLKYQSCKCIPYCEYSAMYYTNLLLNLCMKTSFGDSPNTSVNNKNEYGMQPLYTLYCKKFEMNKNPN